MQSLRLGLNFKSHKGECFRHHGEGKPYSCSLRPQVSQYQPDEELLSKLFRLPQVYKEKRRRFRSLQIFQEGLPNPLSLGLDRKMEYANRGRCFPGSYLNVQS
ncbi:hypothetical protein RUM43_013342 [Polyplax serrata]|uniref:Uncharacterized protein n=1 Tax=Polyplax serrata TaxID=468196 RepID=A0AAN8PHS3_POLSC